MRSGWLIGASILAAAVGALRRLPLEAAIRLSIPATVVLVALGSNWSPSVRSVGAPLWRLALGALFVLAIAFAAVRIDRRELRRRVRAPEWSFAAAFVGLATASAVWSVDPRLTLERLASLALVLGAAGALGLAAAGDRALVEHLLESVLAGATAVALLGLSVLVASPGDALQEATKTIPTRYRGIGENPNTVAMLFAAALPLAAWLVLERRGRARVIALAVATLLAGSIVASGSRAALAVGFAATFAVALVVSASRRDRVRAAVVVGALFAVGIGLGEVPQPNANAQEPAGSACINCKASRYNADQYFRLEDELGAPKGSDPGHRRSLFASTGRREAWRGAIRQGGERPLLGYGFGTEDHVFVDRYYSFYGGSAENSYVGMFLQLGVLGLVLLVVLVGALARAAVLAVRGAALGERSTAVACAAVVFAGLALAFVQSYLYSVGNDTTLTVWLCAFLGVALAAGRRRR
jgi:hypothetical protein